VAPGVHLGECDLAGRFPALWEFLTVTEWDGGELREVGSLSIFTGSQGLQAALNDKDAGRVAFVSGSSLTALLEALDQGIANECLDWRASAAQSQRKGKKRG
jgi:hypothetical protein